MRVYATLPKVTVTKKGERTKEIYVVSLASDTHGASNHRPLAVGSDNETLRTATSGISAAMEVFVVAVSNVFTKIKPKQPLSLSGDGIVLYPPADPAGMLALYFAIVESDHGKRNTGKLLEGIFGKPEVKRLLEDVANATATFGNIPTALLTSMFGTVTELVPKVLQSNRDDILFSHSHSGVDFNNYHASPDGTEFEVGNNRASAVLKVWARE
jgi:hypothetical protein